MTWKGVCYRIKVTWQVLTCKVAEVVIRDWDGAARAYIQGNIEDVEFAYTTLFIAVTKKDELNLKPAPASPSGKNGEGK